jgi:hypothetical protein
MACDHSLSRMGAYPAYSVAEGCPGSDVTWRATHHTIESFG